MGVCGNWIEFLTGVPAGVVDLEEGVIGNGVANARLVGDLAGELVMRGFAGDFAGEDDDDEEEEEEDPGEVRGKKRRKVYLRFFVSVHELF